MHVFAGCVHQTRTNPISRGKDVHKRIRIPGVGGVGYFLIEHSERKNKKIWNILLFFYFYFSIMLVRNCLHHLHQPQKMAISCGFCGVGSRGAACTGHTSHTTAAVNRRIIPDHPGSPARQRQAIGTSCFCAALLSAGYLFLYAREYPPDMFRPRTRNQSG